MTDSTAGVIVLAEDFWANQRLALIRGCVKYIHLPLFVFQTNFGRNFIPEGFAREESTLSSKSMTVV
nr:hypothetical transcript [Hymenolepis microstoma]